MAFISKEIKWSTTFQLGEDNRGQKIMYHKLSREAYEKIFSPAKISRITQTHYRQQVQTGGGGGRQKQTELIFTCIQDS